LADISAENYIGDAEVSEGWTVEVLKEL